MKPVWPYSAASALLTIALGLVGKPVSASEGGAFSGAAPGLVEVVRELYLEVFINERPVGMIGNFKELSSGELAATGQELREVGIEPRGDSRFGENIFLLNELPDLVVAVDEAGQRLFVTVGHEGRAARTLDLSQDADDEGGAGRSIYGALLNYALFATSHSFERGQTGLLKGVSGSFEARLFSPHGTFSQSFLAGYTDGQLDGLTRLATSWTRDDDERLLTWRAGDLVSGGLAWTRPVYLGGVQLQRNFGLRPDLVTLPLPSFSGTAAVPSTLEVYADNTRRFSGAVDEGPFELVNLPAVSGAGSARIVLRDAQGRETEATLPFYASTRLLRRGLLDFSVEAGFPRRAFGSRSSDYDSRLMASASMRYGLTDRLTLEGHVEGGGGLVNGGAGIAFPIGPYGAASLAAAASHFDGESGGLVNGSVELGFEGWSLRGRLQRSFGAYHDIASVTALPVNGDLEARWLGAGVPRAIDQISLGIPLRFDPSTLSLSYTHIEDAHSESSRILSLSYSRRIARRGNFYLTGFVDAEEKENFGVFGGISIAFGENFNASSGIESRPDGTRLVSQLSRQETREEGSFGWRLRSAEGGRSERSASLSYRGRHGRIEGALYQRDDAFQAEASLDGALVLAGGGAFVANRIDGAFAVVDTGAPGVSVSHQNRPVGTSDRWGRLLVPDLVANEENAFSIDPADLPLDADIPMTATSAVPPRKGGVAVAFGIERQARGALVSFVDGEGASLPVGSVGAFQGHAFFIGYDGATYLTGLGRENAVRIELPDGQVCASSFAYRSQPGEQVQLEAVPCR